MYSPSHPLWNAVGIVRPCMTERHRRACLGATSVASTANVEVGPLRQVARTSNARRVGLEEVGLVQRGGPLDTG